MNPANPALLGPLLRPFWLLLALALLIPLAPGAQTTLSSWAPRTGGAEFSLSDGVKVTLTARSPHAVRVQWTPLRPKKTEDWLLVPAKNPPAPEVKEAGAEVHFKLEHLLIKITKSPFSMKAFNAAGAEIAPLPLTAQPPLHRDYRAAWLLLHEDRRDLVFSAIPSGTRAEWISRYVEATGTADMPPKWVMGITSGAYLENDQEMLNLAAKWRELKLPVDAIWTDGGAASDRSINDMTTAAAGGGAWKDATFESMRAQNYLVGRWTMPTIEKRTAVHNEYKTQDWLLKDVNGVLIENFFNPDRVMGAAVDVYNPVAREAHRQLHGQNQGLGKAFDFIKMDERGYQFPHTSPFLGKIEADEVKVWQLLHGVPTSDATRDFNRHGKRRWMMAKFEVPGFQRYFCTWKHDHDGNMRHLAESQHFGLENSRHGIPYFNLDLGGFMSDKILPDQPPASPPREWFIRWVQMGVWIPWMTLFGQEGRGSANLTTVLARAPWMYRTASGGQDEEVMSIYRKAAELRYRLIPWRYSLAWQTHKTGIPSYGSIDLYYPKTEYDKWNTPQVFLGREFMVVTNSGDGGSGLVSKTAKVSFPAGDDWIDYETGAVHKGGTTLADRLTPLSSTPIYVRAGAVIPLGPEGKQHVRDGGLVDSAITWDIYPKGKSEFPLYEDDGFTDDYRRGKYALTTLTVEESGTGVGLAQTPSQGDFTGKRSSRSYFYKVNGRNAPTSVKLGGADLPPASSRADLASKNSFLYDGAAKILWVHVKTPTNQAVTISVNGATVGLAKAKWREEPSLRMERDASGASLLLGGIGISDFAALDLRLSVVTLNGKKVEEWDASALARSAMPRGAGLSLRLSGFPEAKGRVLVAVLQGSGKTFRLTLPAL